MPLRGVSGHAMPPCQRQIRAVEISWRSTVGLNLVASWTGKSVVGASRTTTSATSLRTGDFAGWVKPHIPAMAALASRLVGRSDCDDVVHDALTAAWRKWASYDPGRGTPGAWLLAIVADQARKSRRRRREMPLLGDAGTHLDRLADVDLERAVRRLPARQRLAVELHYFLDLPVTEVAATMGCAEGTVKATLSHARVRLERELGEEL
jgi:RNA polymerase sigma factor (sigma-70 family)